MTATTQTPEPTPEVQAFYVREFAHHLRHIGYEVAPDQLMALADTTDALTARVAELEAALKWYADEWNYFADEECQEMCTAYLGKGKLGSIARALLGGAS